jgi:Arc/MetJ-type ribon-helix-helix transcriptional regulator
MRIQLEISESRREQIRELMEKADFKTYSDLFNNAITLLQWSVRQIEDGCLIVSLNPETERQKELAMPFLQHIAGDSNVAMVAARRSNRKR